MPLIREITFANGEELTEEGLPLLLLFYSPDNPSTKETFKKRVEAELGQHKGTVNVVTADGVMFAHPLHHLGKHKNVSQMPCATRHHLSHSLPSLFLHRIFL